MALTGTAAHRSSYAGALSCGPPQPCRVGTVNPMSLRDNEQVSAIGQERTRCADRWVSAEFRVSIEEAVKLNLVFFRFQGAGGIDQQAVRFDQRSERVQQLGLEALERGQGFRGDPPPRIGMPRECAGRQTRRIEK